VNTLFALDGSHSGLNTLAIAALRGVSVMRNLLIGTIVVLGLGPAFAQAPEGTPTRIRGTVERLDGQMLEVKTRTGQTAHVTLGADFRISGVVKKSLADIKPGDLVGSTSVRGPDGKLRALEVHFLPPTANQGQTPYDLAPNSLMTNAAAIGVAAAADGQVLKVTYKGMDSEEIVVRPDVPVVATVPGDLSLIKPGAAIFVAGVRKPDGSVIATRATLEKDGVKPPM
jgi:hypothetical protein